MAPTIYPSDRDDAAVLARRLLDAAGPARRGEVRTVTDGPAGIAFDVPDDVYAALTGDGDGPAAAGGGGAGPGVIDDAPAGDGAQPAAPIDVDELSGDGEAPEQSVAAADTAGAAGAGRGRRRAPR